MSPDPVRPWGYTATRMRTKAHGLCDCVLRIAWMSPSEVRRYADQAAPDLLNRVARWRLQQPERFNELHAIISGKAPACHA